MGLFSFIKDAGSNILGGKPDAQKIETHLREEFGDRVTSLKAGLEGSMVRLVGLCNNVDTREQVILVAGNIKGVESVNDDGLRILRAGEQALKQGEAAPQPVAAAMEEAPPEELQSVFYTIKSGDTLSKIAKEFLGNAMKYPEIFEANKDVIKDVNKIYPGQTIRIPK